MASRVVPAISLTMVRGSPTMALNSDDLPALGRPTMATGVSAGAASSSRSVAGARRRSTSTRRSSRSPVPRPCTAETSSGSPSPSCVDLGRRRGARRVVDLVGDQEDRQPGAAQHVGDLVVVGQRTGAAVDDEEHDVGRGDGALDLLADVAGEGRVLGGVVAAGVDEQQTVALPLHLDLLAVARDARASRARRSRAMPLRRFTSVDLPALGEPTTTTMGSWFIRTV